MRDKGFSIHKAIQFGWHTVKNNVGFFIILLLISMLIPFLPTFLGNFVSKEFYIIGIFLQLTGKVLGIVVYLGLIKISLKYCNGLKPKVDDLLSSFSLLFKYIPAIIVAMTIFYGIFSLFLGVSFLLGRYVGENLVVSVALFAGVVFLIVFFIVWTIRLSFFPYFIVDQRYGPINSLKASFQITSGLTLRLILLEIVLLLINFAGIIIFLVGLFITVPIYLMTKAHVYRTLSCEPVKPVESGQ